MPSIQLWCRDCHQFITTAPLAEHEGHNVVGIRDDIIVDAMDRLVKDLHRTERLEVVSRGQR